jgi:hypothetical protein
MMEMIPSITPLSQKGGNHESIGRLLFSVWARL